MKLSYGLLGGIVFLILITLANLYAQDPFIKLEPSTSILGYSQGVTWADYNNDGFQDVYVTNGDAGAKQGNLLYLNNGNETFTQITSGEIVTDAFISTGATWGDYDNDGDLDVYVATTEDNTSGPKANCLYSNDGDGTFTKITSTAGAPVTDQEFSCAPVWGDYNNDGHLDLFVKNGWFNKQPNSLYRSDGDATFTDITGISLVSTATDVASFIAGASWVDYDMDGDLDLYTCSGSGANNLLWRNDGGEVFTKLALFDTGDSQACSWGDYDNDGDQDLFISNYGEDQFSPEANFLYRNDGSDTFVRITSGAFGTDIKFSQGSAWGDIDNDGDLDLYVGNDGDAGTYPSDLYINNGDGTFTKNTTTVAATQSGYIYGLAMGDFNNDGFLDIFAARQGQNYLYKNVEISNGNTNHWIKFKLVGTTSNSAGIGAKIKVRATINSTETSQWREISGQTGFASQNSLIAHFGLGDATIIAEVRVEWPSGTVQTLTNVSVDQLLTITEGATSESITLTSPNGGEDWTVGSLQEITWSSSGTSGTVDLEYSTNNGSNWTTIESSTDDDGSYNWTIPNAPSTECLVRVTDTDGDPSDESNATFTISAPASITVTSPNGGEDWQVGSSQTITWTSENTSGNVHIEYSTDNGSLWSDVIASTIDDGTQSWTIPNDVSTLCLVRVSDTDGDPSDVSDAVFTISAVPEITVTAPNGGEDWQVGSSQTITWTSVNTSGNVKIEYSTDNGGAWTDIVASTLDDGTHEWMIPAAPSTQCLIKITDTDGSPSDQSDAVFTISAIPAITITAPNGGETWAATTIETITWTSVNTSGNVKLEYSTNNGGAWTDIIASTADDGSHNWTIPVAPSTECLVRVSDTDGDPSDVSDAVFTITAEPGDPVTDLTASVSVDNILLEWSPLVDVTTYNVYRGTSYDFVPDFAGGTNRIATNITDEDTEEAGVQWTDTGNGADVVGDLNNNYFYRVTGSSGVETQQSNLAGEFDIQFEATSGTDINELVVILNTQNGLSPILQAEDLAQAIPNCTDVYRWDATGQGQIGHPKGVPFENFDILPGYPYIVNVTANTIWTHAGTYSMPTFDLVTTSGTDINHIGVPFEKSSLTTAEALGDDILDCTDVYYWDVVGQGQVGHPVGTPVQDFAVSAAHPYYVNVTSASTWPSGGAGAQASLASGNLQKSDRSSSPVGNNVPHTAFGKFASTGEFGNLTLTAWIQGREDEIVTESSVGAGLDQSYWWIGVGNFPSAWKIGETLHVEIRTDAGVLVGKTELKLTNAGSDQAPELNLQVISEVALQDGALPENYKLYANYPNPFNPQTTIAFDLPQQDQVRLEIYDLRGVLVKSILNKKLQAGRHQVLWDGTDMTGRLMASGLYFYKLTANEFVETRKMILAK